MLTHSQRVRATDFDQPWLRTRVIEMAEDPVMHRKLWEMAYIAQVYDQTAGRTWGPSVLGFGCGVEPLPAWFARQNARVLVTDALEGGKWAEPSPFDRRRRPQHSSSLTGLPWRGICSKKQWDSLVTYRPVDMRDIPEDLRHGTFDFVWSSGSMEHIGGIRAALDFVLTAQQCLRPGGVAVHTTEWNFASMGRTLEAHDLCLLRRGDFLQLEDELAAIGSRLWPLDLEPGLSLHDNVIDHHPYQGIPHLAISIGEWVTTSVALVVERGGA